jgi:hypothetical protein
MSGKPFDGSMKDLVELAPLAWAQWLCPGPITGATMEDADLSTVTAAADKVLRVRRPGGDLLVNLEAESGHAGGAPEKALFYSGLLHHRHELPVRSVILLRPEANATNVTGQLELRENETDPEPYLVFRYRVVRLWQEPLGPLLSGPTALLPLAPLTDEAAGSLEATVGRVVARLEAETPPETAGKMEEAVYVLLGLRYSFDVVRRIMERNARMKESSFVQGLLAEGAERGAAEFARETIIQLGQDRLGLPGPETRRTLEAITDLGRLRSMIGRLRGVSSWDELLAG